LLTLVGGLALCASAWLFLRAGTGVSFVQAPPLATALDALPMAAGFGLMLAGTARPVLSGVVLGATALGLRLTDEVKREVLHEPVNFSDRGELPELVRHPQLYLPFAGTGLVLAAAATLLLAAGALTWAEPPLWRRSWPAAAAALLLAGAAARAGFVLPALRPAVRRLAALYTRLRPSRDPEQDARRLGPLASLVVHATLAAAERPSRVAAAQARPAAPWPATAGPVVLVQAESFMDPARLHPALAGALPHFTALRQQAALHGALQVPSWGANTVRTEFAVLTGVAEPAVGLDRFNPYEAFAQGGLPSIAWAAKAAGYATVVVHPFDPGFYSRRKVLPRLGFDRFVGPEAFARKPQGQYASDAEVAEVAANLVRTLGPRVFVFVITMDGHGPWTGAGPLPPELQDLPEAGPLAGWLAAMQGTDRMLPALTAALQEAGEGWLALYGDHQPSLPAAFDALHMRDRRTDYLIWGVGQAAGGRLDTVADQLGGVLAGALQGAG